MQATLLQERPRPEPPPPAIVARVQPYLEELFGGSHHIPRDPRSGRPHLMVDDFGEECQASNVAVPLVHKSMASHDGDFGIWAFVLAFKYRLRVEVEYLDQESEHELYDGHDVRDCNYYKGLVLRIWDRSTPDRHGWRHPGLDDLIGMVEKMRGKGEVA